MQTDVTELLGLVAGFIGAFALAPSLSHTSSAKPKRARASMQGSII
jgi:hypothetical protein